MTELWQWLVDLPKHFATMGEWLITPIEVAGLSITPLAMLGGSVGAFVVVLVALKIKSLIF